MPNRATASTSPNSPTPHKASLPEQRHAIATLGELCETIEREQLASPSVIVVGDVLSGLGAIATRPPVSQAA